MNIDQAQGVRPSENLDWKTLESYLRQHLPETEEEMSYAQFHGGHANLTYLIKFGETEYVLRRPPFGKIAPGAHDMKREYKVLSKLYKFFPQAPRAFHLCEDDAVVGSKFVVMERRKGIVMRYSLPEEFSKFENAEQRATDALIRTQAALHTVDVEAAELTELGKPEGFAARQVAGWAKRWELSKTEENSNMDAVAKGLAADIPIPQAVSIVHNDIKFDNCQFQADNPDAITSVFDWDMTTIGDPLTDFGSTLGYWPDERFKEYRFPISLKGNFPTKAYVREKYAEHTGYDLSRMDWYESLAYFKAAVITQQLYARYKKGDSKDARMEKMGPAAKMFAEISRRIMEKDY